MKFSRYLMRKAREDSREFKKIVAGARRMMKDSFNERSDAAQYVFEFHRLKDAQTNFENFRDSTTYLGMFNHYISGLKIMAYLTREALRHDGTLPRWSVLDLSRQSNLQERGASSNKFP